MTTGIILFLCAVQLLLFGCQQRELIKTPNLFLRGDYTPFKDCPPQVRNNQVNILYATDRLLVPGKGGVEEYGYLRSPSLAYGNCRVEIGKDLSWTELTENSVKEKRKVPLALNIEQVLELGRFPPIPLPLIKVQGQLMDDPKSINQQEKISEEFRQEMTNRLAHTPRKEAFVFIHGYNNTFQDAIFVMTDLWHFLGRTGVPIVYTWPAGHGGLRGYNYDRESGDFTVFHLKTFLMLLASCPDLEGIHLLAHSRGTEILISAVRELIIELRAAGKDPNRNLKINSLTLAAPDIDLEVFTQRTGGDKVGLSVGQVTIYVSEEDKALGLSTWLFSGLERVGKLAYGNLNENIRKRIAQSKFVTVVDARVPSGFIGHSYFYSDPAVSSDLILQMGYGRSAGSQNGRPLIPVGPNFWRIEKDYPYMQ